MRRGRRWVPPAPGMMPRDDSVCPIFERPSSTMIRKSQQSVSSLPPPRACPLMAAITGFGQLSIVAKWAFILFMNAAIWSIASADWRSMVPSIVRSAPTLKYFSYSEASTITRASGSSPRIVNAAARSSIRSSAIALLPLRRMTTRAIGPSRLISISSLIALCREQRNAARHLDYRAGDVAGLVRAEERDRVRDVLRLPESLEHRARLETLVQRVVRRCRFACFRFDDPRRDRVGGDVVPAAFERGGLRKADQRRLGRRIARLAESTERAGHRRHEDDAAPLVLDQVGPGLLRAVEGTGEVDAYVPIPQLVGLVRNLGGMIEGRGVVDQDVDLAELVLDLLEHLAHLLAVSDIHLDGERAPPHLADLLRGRVGMHPALRHRVLRERAALSFSRLLQVRVVFDQHIGDDDVRALTRERERVLAAQPARGARDHSNPSREIEHVLSPQFDGGSPAGKSARDDQPLDFRGPLPDLIDLRVAEPLLDGVLLDVPVAPEDLDRIRGDLHRHIARKALRHRSLRPLERATPGRHPSGAPDEQASGVDLHRHVRELEADRLVLPQRLAELLAFLCVIERELECRARDAERARGDTRASRFQCHQRTERSRAGVLLIGLAAEPVVQRDVTVLEDDLGRVACAHAELLLLAPHLQARRALGHEERGDARRALRRVGVRIDDVVVGDAAVGAELFGAVEYVAVTDTRGARLHGQRVRSGVRFSQAEAAEDELVGIRELRQPAFLLLLGAARANAGDGETHRLDAHRYAGAAPMQLFVEQELGEKVETLPAIFLW